MYQEGKGVSVAEEVREGEKIGKAECGAGSLQILEGGIKILCILPPRIFFLLKVAEISMEIA